MPSDIDWARLAALIEAQSSIHIGERGNSAYLRVSVTRANPVLIKWLHKTFGGSAALHRKDGASGWHVDCAKAYDVLRGCYPYLIFKQPQADIAFAYEKTILNRPKGRGAQTPSEVVNLRKSLREQLNQAKREISLEENVDLLDEDPSSVVNDQFLPDMSSKSDMTEEQKIMWAAGFFDGEGCAAICRQETRGSQYLQYQMQVSVCQKSPQPLKVFHDLFGGSFYSYMVKGVEYWRWCASNNHAKRMLELLSPFLILKKERAQICIEFQTELLTWNRDYGRQGYPEFVHQAREAYYQRMKLLNQRSITESNPQPRKPGPRSGYAKSQFPARNLKQKEGLATIQ